MGMNKVAKRPSASAPRKRAMNAIAMAPTPSMKIPRSVPRGPKKNGGTTGAAMPSTILPIPSGTPLQERGTFGSTVVKTGDRGGALDGGRMSAWPDGCPVLSVSMMGTYCSRCAHQDSNLGPPRYKLGALPTELCAHAYHYTVKRPTLNMCATYTKPPVETSGCARMVEYLSSRSRCFKHHPVT